MLRRRTVTSGKKTIPKARKEHICCECGSQIDIGEQYQYITGILDDSWETYRTCLPCARIRTAANAELDEAVAFTCLYEVTGSEFEDAVSTQSKPIS